MTPRKTTIFDNIQDYEFPEEPRIGYSNAYYGDYSSSYNSHFYGCISDIIVFKKGLSTLERQDLFSNFQGRALEIKSSADTTDESKRNLVNENNGYAGFNIGPDW